MAKRNLKSSAKQGSFDKGGFVGLIIGAAMLGWSIGSWLGAAVLAVIAGIVQFAGRKKIHHIR